MGLLIKLFQSAIVGVATWLVCLLAALLLTLLEVRFAVAIGGFLGQYAPLIAFLAAVWFFFTGATPTWTMPWSNQPPPPQQPK